MPMDDGLGFRGRSALVDSSVKKQRRRQDLPRFCPFVGGKDLLLLV
jgi:hypothetical protein